MGREATAAQRSDGSEAHTLAVSVTEEFAAFWKLERCVRRGTAERIGRRCVNSVAVRHANSRLAPRKVVVLTGSEARVALSASARSWSDEVLFVVPFLPANAVIHVASFQHRRSVSLCEPTNGCYLVNRSG